MNWPPAEILENVTDHQREAYATAISGGNIAILGGGPGSGKASPTESIVMTADGPRLLGAIEPGDFVIGADGTSVEVLAVHPQGLKEVFLVKFSDGSSLECCKEHLWYTTTASERNQAGEDSLVEGGVRRLDEIWASLKCPESDEWNHQIPLVEPVEFNSVGDLLMDPYLMGLFVSQPGILSDVPGLKILSNDVLDEVVSRLPPSVLLELSEDEATHEFTDGVDGDTVLDVLIEYELMDTVSKHMFIPEEYLYACVEDRLLLLKGILDGAGLVRYDSIELTTPSERIAKGMMLLLQGLGCVCSVATRSKRGEIVSWRLNINIASNLTPFFDRSKQDLFNRCSMKAASRSIKSVDSIGQKECVCISVDAEDGLYVADQFIVTHNTHTMASVLSAIQKHDFGPFGVAAPTGKAAVRITETLQNKYDIDITGQTIHRLLGVMVDPSTTSRYGRPPYTFLYNESNKLPLKYIFVDEASMLGVPLFATLLEAIGTGTKLFLTGDIGQLPPVEHGCPLRDMIAAKMPFGELKELHRNAGEGAAICKSIRAGGMYKPASDLDLEADPPRNVRHIETDTSEQSLGALLELLQTTPSTIDPVWDVQVILACNEKGELSREKVNEVLHSHLNPNPPAVDEKLNFNFRVDDKVMCTENCVLPLKRGERTYETLHDNSNSEKGEFVANGEIGRVTDVWTEGRKNNKPKMSVYFDAPKRTVVVGKGNSFRFKLAYAITTHKCVSPDTLVETPEGIMPIRELPFQGEILTPSGVRKYTDKITLFDQPSIEIRFSDGTQITVTEDHGCEVLDEGEWVRKPALGLKLADQVRMPLGRRNDEETNRIVCLPESACSDLDEFDWTTPLKVDCRFAQFLGMMAQGGEIEKAQFRYTTRHLQLSNTFADLCVELFGIPKPVSGNGLGEFFRVVKSPGLAMWLIDVLESPGRIPRCILSSSLDCQYSYLEGLVTDSWMDSNEAIEHVRFQVKSKSMKHAVHLMLKRLGFRSRQLRGDIYGIHIFGRDAGEFYWRNTLGLPTADKTSRHSATSVKIPFPNELLDAHSSITSSKNAKQWLQNSQLDGRIDLGLALLNLQELTGSGAERQIAEIVSEQINYDYVKVEQLTQKTSTAMCVTVLDEDHQFLQNGLPWFNCQGSSAPVVVYLVDDNPSARRVSSREFVYTALSRFEDLMFTIGKRQLINRDLQKVALRDRSTFLKEQLLGQN